ncbi:helix-turn-helix transcriptional regulator [bacterium]|nr:helix-turn-helix transcriptional regulator [bacterium]
MKSQSNGPNTDSADLIFQLRQTLGLTQEKLAQKLGVSFPTINRWENGRSKPSPLALKQIEDLLQDLGDQGKQLLKKHFGGTR